MLSKIQFDILHGCYFERELFYMLFAQVNYGGQVFPKSVRERKERYKESQIEGAREFKISISAGEIVENAIKLISSNYLKCWSVDREGKSRELKSPTVEDFEQYKDYKCLTWKQHIDRFGFGYGPHEFKITKEGRAEIDKDTYSKYLARL